MLDEYKDIQKVAYKILINSVNNDKLSHAYLIESTNISDGLEFAIAISKFLLCPNHYTNSSKCENCSQCMQIEDENFLEFRIIRPDGKNIKKNQILELQENFRYKSVIGNKKIYLIESVELLNSESANALLKFLEEPSEGIIAILLTENMYEVYETIKSRCQILKMNEKKQDEKLSSIQKISNYLYENNDIKNKFLENNPDEIMDLIIEYVTFLEENKEKTIIFKNKDISKIVNDDFTIQSLFKVLTLFYKDLLNYKLKKELEYFFDYEESFKNIIKLNTEEEIAQKLNIVINLGVKLNYNVNANLIFDKLVISLAEV